MCSSQIFEVFYNIEKIIATKKISEQIFIKKSRVKKNLKLGLFLEKSIEMYYKTYQFIE